MSKLRGFSMFTESDPFDLALALYHWLQHNWEGQADPLYEAFCELTAPGMYRPARSQEYFESLKGSEAETLYSELTHENYRQALDLVLNYEAEDVG
jgi:hypothetical protein